MTNIEQDDRNNFENAAKDAFEPPFLGERASDGYGYSDGYLDRAWWGWKAALKIERERQAGELDKAIAYIKHLEKDLTYLAENVNFKLTSFITNALAARPASLELLLRI